jgi:hypothetical protein
MAVHIVVAAEVGQHKVVARNLPAVVVDYMLGLAPETRNAVVVDMLVRSHMKIRLLLRPWLYCLFFYAHYQNDHTYDQYDYPR